MMFGKYASIDIAGEKTIGKVTVFEIGHVSDSIMLLHFGQSLFSLLPPMLFSSSD
jgi:hypothetical protein